MRRVVPPRLMAPMFACVIAGAAAVVGGACLPATSPSPPTLRTGNYVLASPASGSLSTVDSAGRRLRVIADTLAFNVTDQTYEQRGTVAITLAGGTEQAPAPFTISRRRYAVSTPQTFVLSSTLYGGMITGNVTSSSSIVLQMPDHTTWFYNYR